MVLSTLDDTFLDRMPKAAQHPTDRQEEPRRDRYFATVQRLREAGPLLVADTLPTGG